MACLALAMAGAASGSAGAQTRGDNEAPPATGGPKIAAVVNREAISQYDLAQRVRLVSLGGRAPADSAAQRRLAAEVLRTMIVERVQIQEARRQNLTVTDREVQEQMAEVERRSRLNKGDLAKVLRERGIEPRTLEDQIRAQIAWAKVVGRVVQPQIRVADAEVRTILKRYENEKDKIQYRLQEIFLPADRPDQEAQSLRAAQVILEQMRMGASFDALARQFSQSSTAGQGGDMGWLFEGQIEPELERAVKRLKVGQVAGPIRGIGGYYVIRLSDRRSFGGAPDPRALALARANFTIPRSRTPAEVAAAQDKAAKFAAHEQSCDGWVKAAQAAGASEAQILPAVLPERIPPTLRGALTALKENQIARPITTPEDVLVFMRCPDSARKNTLPGEKEIRESLQQQRLRAFADRYLKELRRSAFVEIRS
jgi:peptidyl-prolyl cis-trans isomerase SurA